MRSRFRLRKAALWAFVVAFASLCGGLLFAYSYVTDSDTIARVVKSGAQKYLPGATLDLSRARLRPLTGEVNLNHVTLRQTIEGRSFPTLRVPWLHLRCDPRALLRGRFEPREVVVAQPTLRLRRRQDGTWNLQGLLADPWPGPVMRAPPILIQNGTIELSDGPADAPAAAILRDVGVRVQGVAEGVLAFEGTAKGDAFDRVALQGLIETGTGRITLKGDVARLVLSDTLRGRVPPEVKPYADQLGLTGGELDLRLNRLAFDPAGAPKVKYDLEGSLRGGSWNCPKLPFPLNDLTADFAARDGELTVGRAQGHYGATTVRVERGRFVAGGDPGRAPLELKIAVDDLKLDDRLQRWTPARFAKLWDEFLPSGRVSLTADVSRASEGGPLRHKVAVECLDVAMTYHLFKYPLDHIRGRVVWEGDRVAVEHLSTLVGGITASGTVLNPGPRAVVRLDFRGDGLPIDKALLDALPPEVRKVVDDFKPTGTVRGTLTLNRAPPERPEDDPKKGKVAIDAYLDLGARCGIQWVGMPYPVNDLTGRLEIHPDLWVFKDMRGRNGQAVITGSGRVSKVPGSGEGPAAKLKVALRVKAEKLPFNDQLFAALQPAWQKTWAILDPIGSSDVDAEITVEPGRQEDVRLVMTPLPNTSVRLRYSRDPKPGIDPGGTFTLRMEDVSGRFAFHNGPVEMSDVGFRFHEAPVRFARGRVVVEDSGRFDLAVKDLWVSDLRLNQPLRAIMPPVMAGFAQRLDDGRPFTLKGNMGLGWSGVAGAPVRCQWDEGLVVFDDNKVQIQPGMALEHVQGQLDHVRGNADGESFEVHGALRLESVSLLDQQLTRLSSPLDVVNGAAKLDDLKGSLLGGTVAGKLGVTLDATPKYYANLVVSQADLLQYAKTLPGRQKFRGRLDARLDLSGFGGDLRTLQGGGEAHVANGDLGELPNFLRLVKILNLSEATKTAFDTADVVWSVQNGKSTLDPIRFTGDAFSLLGRGTMDVQGDLDVKLRVVYGRDRWHLRVVSDAIREAGGQFLVVRIFGTPSFPKFKLDVLPTAVGAVKSIGRGRVRARE